MKFHFVDWDPWYNPIGGSCRTCDRLCLRVHKLHVTISQPQASTLHSSAAVTHVYVGLLIAPHFIYPEGWKPFANIKVKLSHL